MEALLTYDSSDSDDEEGDRDRSLSKDEKKEEKCSKISEEHSFLKNREKNNINRGSSVSLRPEALNTKEDHLQSPQGQSLSTKESIPGSILSPKPNIPLDKIGSKTTVEKLSSSSENTDKLNRFPFNNSSNYRGIYFTTGNRCNYICVEKNLVKAPTCNSNTGPSRTSQEVRTTNSLRTKPYISKRERDQLQHKSEPEISETQIVGCANKLGGKEMQKIENQSGNIEGHNVINRPPQKVWIQFQGHSKCVNHVKWSPTKQSLLASASMDQTVAIWDTNRSGLCLNRLTYHEGAVKDVKWSYCGTQVLSCGYDKCARLVDIETGKQVQSFQHQGYVTCVQFHPSDPNLFLAGTSRNGIFSWDIRENKIVSSYQASFGQVQDVVFLPDGEQFISAAEVLRRNATDKGIMVWDFRTTAIMSNQIYQEAFTCTCLRVHPGGSYFVAQSNGNYMAIFSTKRPYKLNKYKRYEGHQVAAYSIGCDFSPDGSLAISGSADGNMYVYNSHTSHNISSLSAHSAVCTDVSYHPSMPSTVASCSLDGQIIVWL